MNSACDIGCDEYGYPIRDEDGDFAAGFNASHVWTPACGAPLTLVDALLDRYEREQNVDDIIAGYELKIGELSKPLSASWHHMACITAPPPRTMPARALAYRTQKIGLR